MVLIAALLGYVHPGAESKVNWIGDLFFIALLSAPDQSLRNQPNQS